MGNKKEQDIDKEKAKLKKFDPRGTQTLFRTLSRNHYNLLKMMDNKASLLLTINSIIITLIMGALYIAPESERQMLSTTIMMNFCMLSMIFALLSMLPHRYLGKRFRNSKYNGSLYAGNFASLSLEEFKLEFERIMNCGESVYDEMMMDIYFLGRIISFKQRLLLFSFGIFILGLSSTMVISVFVS